MNTRLQNLRKYMSEKNIKVGLIFEPDNQYYISNFKAITYSRPIVTVVTEDKIELIVPGLEEDHALEVANVDKIYVYHEVPKKKHLGVSYLDHVGQILSRYPSNTKVGVETSIVNIDFKDYLEGKGFEVLDIGKFIFEMRYVKDDKEIECLNIAGMLSDIAIKGSLDSLREGISELEFDCAGDAYLMSYLSKNYPNKDVGFANWTCSGLRTVQPHLDSNSRLMIKGDVVIHSRQVWYENYRAENERTFILGKPTDKQRHYFNIAVEAQQAGLDIIKPGIPARLVDEASRKVFEKYNVDEFINHRIGHGLGLSEHEEPYLRFDNELILQEGMVFSIEPGIYVPEIGGFRHSDTVIITKDGARCITSYERNIEDLIFEI